MKKSEEKKKLVYVMASPHAQGTTQRLANAFLEPFRQSGRWQEHELRVYDVLPHPCTACGLCKEINGCRWHDLDEFDALLRESDLLVVASPVYNLSFPAPMKAMLDRWQRYFEARFARGEKPCIQKGRKAILLLTRGSKDARGDDICRQQISQSFSVMHTELTGVCVWPGTDQGENGYEKAAEQARAMALAIEKDLW